MKPENINYIKRMFAGVATTNISGKIILAFLYIPYAFFFDKNHETGLVALLVLIMFDMFTGIASARHSGNIIKSAKVVRTAYKIIFYFLFISAGHMAENVIGANLFLDETILAVLAMTELISIMENIGKLGYAVPMKLLDKLHKLRDEN